MKICFLADAANIHTVRWAKYLVNKGLEVHLISLKPPNDDEIKKLNCYILKDRIPIPFIKTINYTIQVKKLLGKISPDVLHAHYLANYGVIGAFTNFHPFLISIWGSDVLVAPNSSKILKYMESYALRKSDVITTIPEFMKDYILKVFEVSENKIVRIPWGIDLELFKRGYEKEVKRLKGNLLIKNNSPVILSNRAITPHYNIEKIVDAIPYIIKRHPDVIFIFTKGNGTSEYTNKIKTKVTDLGVTENTRFIEKMVLPQEMAIYLNISDAIISIPKTDQFASSIMEGMACGVIPIVGNLEVYKQYLIDRENAFFVNGEDPLEISKRVIYCIEHRELKENFYQINREIIEKYENWNINANKMTELYIKLGGGI